MPNLPAGTLFAAKILKSRTGNGPARSGDERVRLRQVGADEANGADHGRIKVGHAGAAGRHLGPGAGTVVPVVHDPTVSG